MVGNHLFYVNWGRKGVSVSLPGINHLCGTPTEEPKPPIRCFGRGGLTKVCHNRGRAIEFVEYLNRQLDVTSITPSIEFGPGNLHQATL
jgi:hypothetical protein